MNFIGNNCKIDESVQLGDNVTICDNTIIRKNVIIGNNVTIEENCIIGETPTVWGVDDVNSDVWDRKLIIEDNVNIKCFTVIERGANGYGSIIGEGTGIGSHCYFGHDAIVGKHNLIMPYVFFCGGVVTGERVLIFSHVTVFNNVTIGNKTKVFHGANVFSSTKNNDFIIGENGDTLKEYCKKKNFLKCSSKTLQRIKDLEDTINGKDCREHQETVQQG